MRSLILSSVAGLIAVQSSAVTKAHSFVDMLDLNPKIRISEKDKTRDCADFSGNWKGTCTAKDQTADEAVTIEQKGCQLIEVTGHEGRKIVLPVGGVMNASITVPGNPGFTGSGEITTHWNKEHTVLQVIMGKSGKKLAVDSPTGGTMVSQQVKLVEGKLAVDFTVYHHKDKTTGACEFSKQ